MTRQQNWVIALSGSWYPPVLVCCDGGTVADCFTFLLFWRLTLYTAAGENIKSLLRATACYLTWPHKRNVIWYVHVIARHLTRSRKFTTFAMLTWCTETTMHTLQHCMAVSVHHVITASVVNLRDHAKWHAMYVTISKDMQFTWSCQMDMQLQAVVTWFFHLQLYWVSSGQRWKK